MFWISYSRKGFTLTFNTSKGDLVIEGTITIWYYLFKYVSIHSMVLYDENGYTRAMNDYKEVYELLGVHSKLGLKNHIIDHYEYHLNGGVEESTSNQIVTAVIKGIVMFLLIYFGLKFLGIIR